MGESKIKYNGWIVSDNFFKRAFAILGHTIVAQLIIAVGIFIMIMLFG